jgi:succinate dehydrogenase hydrophobic anchor subunit
LYSNSEITNMVLAMLLSFYIIVALYSCVFALRRLLRPGVSKAIRFIFLMKHFFYVASFIVIWTTFLASSYYHLFNPMNASSSETKTDNTLMNTIDRVSSIASFSTGIILTFIRVHEPYFKFLMKR